MASAFGIKGHVTGHTSEFIPLNSSSPSGLIRLIATAQRPLKMSWTWNLRLAWEAHRRDERPASAVGNPANGTMFVNTTFVGTPPKVNETG